MAQRSASRRSLTCSEREGTAIRRQRVTIAAHHLISVADFEFGKGSFLSNSQPRESYGAISEQLNRGFETAAGELVTKRSRFRQFLFRGVQSVGKLPVCRIDARSSD
jgi:hypothetical protein